MLKQKIIDFCNNLGLDTLGFIPCRRFDELVPFYEERQRKNLQNEFESKVIEERVNPFSYMAEGKTILSIAFPYWHDAKVTNGFSIYTKRADYHRVVKKYLNEIATYIETLGGKAITLVDSNHLPERYIAYLAGVGFIGKNQLVITQKYGSYVFLGEIITDLDLEVKESNDYRLASTYTNCGTCERCLKSCPTKAISDTLCNPNQCLSYITQKKDLSDEEIKLLKGNVFGCDYCQLKCPYNQKAAKQILKEFETLPYMEDEIEVYANMNNQFFKEKMSGTSCGWRGKNVIKRNAIIRMAREGKDISYLKGDSPYINDYIKRLSQLKNES